MLKTITLEEGKELVEKIVNINRVNKVTKGGKKVCFSVLAVVGDTKGRVGAALGKANEVPNAIRKAISQAKRSMVKVKLRGTTIPHEVMGHFGAAKVLLKPAAEGTGVIAAGSVRAVCECAGIKDILTKCLKSNNPINTVRATLEGFSQLKFKISNNPGLKSEEGVGKPSGLSEKEPA